ncbi:MAG: cell division protein SepF [Actinomycetota bacterium]
MPGVWKKTLTYLGLVEDEDYDELDEVSVEGRGEPAPVRRIARAEPAPEMAPTEPRMEGIVRTIPTPRPSGSSIHKSEPKRFNEAREIADRFKNGIPVIMNLQGTDDAVARRLVDFASGLVYGLDGKIEMVANRVYLLTPQDMEVSAEERERIAGGGFYNQF